MQLIELFQLCWESDPDKRPKMEEVVEILKNIKV